MKKFLISEYNDLKDLSDYEMTPKQAIIAKTLPMRFFTVLDPNA